MVSAPAAPVPPAAAARRDSAIDMLRGLALLTITVNHITGIVVRGGLQGAPFPTLSHYGFSSAAEIFFLLSGYLVGLVYLRADRPVSLARFTRAVTARAGKLYLWNLALFLLVLPLAFASPMLAKITYFHYFLEGGFGAFAGFLGVYIQPFCLEILAAYIVLLLLAPAFAFCLLRWPKLTLAASVLVWWVSHENPWLRLPGGAPGGDWKWNFSPGSWQLIFFGALAAGRWRLLDRVRTAFAADKRWFCAALALLALLTFLFLLQAPFGFSFLGQSKERLGLLRLFHALTVCATALGFFWAWPSTQGTLLGRWVGAIGAASLPCFVASVAISYAAGLIWVELAPFYEAYLLLCVAAIVALVLFAQAKSALPALRLARLRTQAT